MDKFGGIVKAGILYLTGIADWRMKYQNLIPENITEMVQPRYLGSAENISNPQSSPVSTIWVSIIQP